jgi:N4-gp56 family major capsid protein
MALTVSATDTELPKPVNTIFQQTLLRNARVRAPYFIGTQSAEVMRQRGTLTTTWRRIENLSAATTALTEITGNAAYGQGRTPAALSVSDVTATASKYGNFVILNEEAELVNFNTQMDKIMEVIGINAGQSLNQLQRNIAEDNLTLVYAGAGTSDGDITSAVTLNDIKQVVNTLDKNSAMTFTPMTTGSTNIGTTPILPAYWGICHPDMAVDVAGLTGFKSVESYAGQTNTVMGEFGTITVAGKAVRFISTEDASVDAASGGAVSSHGLNGTSGIDLYTMVIYGQDCLGSVGFGNTHPDGTFMAGDDINSMELIVHPLGSGGAADPYNEISTIAWKSWHTGAVLNSAWGRGIRAGATDLSA